jgi:acetoin utilization deacetylase AcuC-like enzyme
MTSSDQLSVVFSDRMVARGDQGYSPSAGKPAQVVADWQAHGLPLRLIEPEPVTVDQFALAHSRTYVEAVLGLRCANGFGTVSQEVADSLPYTTGALLTAARLALRERGAVCAPCSGFHHAHWDRNWGFCTFNGLMVTARCLLTERSARRVAILDCDQHFGDGTEGILERLGNPPEIRHFSAGGQFNRSYQLSRFWEVLDEELSAMADCDVLLYQAGADPHVEDPLGGWLTTEELRERDARVFDAAARWRLPIVWDLAGGYQRDANGGIAPVLEIHRNTAREHLRVFGGREGKG